MNKQSKRKLAVNRETLRALEASELARVGGGAYFTVATCNGCPSNPPACPGGGGGGSTETCSCWVTTVTIIAF